MKTSVDIINLPVIDISEGVEIGVATKIVINPTEGSVAALVVNDDQWYLGAKLLPFSAITGLGESAITIVTGDSILSIENAPDIKQLLIMNISVIGTKVLTKTGHMQGTVTEFLIDDTGKIITCEIETLTGGTDSIPCERILTFGKKVLVIKDENDSSTSNDTLKLTKNIPVVESTPEIEIPTVPELPTIPEIPEVAPVVESTPVVPVVANVPPVTPTPTPKESSNDNSAKKFDEKQRKYLLGKQASRRIETDNGVLIVEQGGEINEEVIQKAKMAGKFVELSMNIQ